MEKIKNFMSNKESKYVVEIIEQTKKIYNRLPTDENVQIDFENVLSSLKESFSETKLHLELIQPRLESLKKDFRVGQIILNKTEELTEEDKKNLEAVITQVGINLTVKLDYDKNRENIRKLEKDILEIRRKIEKNTKLDWCHKHPFLTRLLSGLGGFISFGTGSFLTCILVEASVLGAAGTLTLIGGLATGGIAVFALIFIFVVVYLIYKTRSKSKKESIPKYEEMDSDLETLLEIIKKYSAHLAELSKTQGKFDGHLDDLKRCLILELYKKENKDVCQELAKDLEEQIETIKKFLSYEKDVSSFLENI